MTRQETLKEEVKKENSGVLQRKVALAGLHALMVRTSGDTVLRSFEVIQTRAVALQVRPSRP